MTLLTTSEAGYKTSIHQSVMFLCSFVEENQQNVGWNWAPEALTLQNILFLLVKQPHKLFCPFNAKHGLLSKDAIFNFWSSCDWERLLTPKSKIQDDGNENTIVYKYQSSECTHGHQRYSYFDVLYQFGAMLS